MRQALVNGRILANGRILEDHTLLIAEGRIADIAPADDPRLPEMPHNDDPTPETIRRIGAAHRRFGTTGFLPTLISDDLAVIEHAIGAVAAALRENVPGLLGIHLEGPFLSPDRKAEAPEEDV